MGDDNVSNHSYICWRTSLASIDPEPHTLGTKKVYRVTSFRFLRSSV
ncbi:unnamed protein product [Arabidopsis thaliana]|uniref:(thale cress) hypothetical protein n=1 Tax=Arabidopsis thaliana TaxID=3702 RepID=A0A7G2DX69_ARATH|nr:unnamed protein product [Arabidopsis thaliana]